MLNQLQVFVTNHCDQVFFPSFLFFFSLLCECFLVKHTGFFAVRVEQIMENTSNLCWDVFRHALSCSFIELLSTVHFFFHLILANLLGLPLLQCNQCNNKLNHLRIVNTRMIIILLEQSICKKLFGHGRREVPRHLFLLSLVIQEAVTDTRFACSVAWWQGSLVDTFSLCVFSSHFVLIASREERLG